MTALAEIGWIDFDMWRRSSLCIALLMLAPSALAGEVNTTSPIDAWKRDVSSRLTRARRYPSNVLPGEGGTAMVAFRVDRTGHLMSSWLVENSGVPALDAEALAIVERAQPFAVPPAEMAKDDIRLTVPFTFVAPGTFVTERSLPESWKKEVSARLNGARRGAKTGSAALSAQASYTALVGISLGPTGKLVSSWLVEPGSVPKLDAEALAIVKRAQPFPPPPIDLKGEEFKLILPIAFVTVAPWDEPALKAKLNSVCRGC